MADQKPLLDNIRGALQAGTASREYQQWASDVIWNRGKRIADLEAALRKIADTPIIDDRDFVLIGLVSVARNVLHNSRLSQ